jgi:hypothetical protein
MRVNNVWPELFNSPPNSYKRPKIVSKPDGSAKYGNFHHREIGISEPKEVTFTVFQLSGEKQALKPVLIQSPSQHADLPGRTANVHSGDNPKDSN